MTKTIDPKEVAIVKAQATKAMTYATSLQVTTEDDYSAALS